MKEELRITDFIYVITTFEKVDIYFNGFPDYGDIRSIGWFTHYDDALDIVTNNKHDIFEYYYEYAVIEKLPAGMYPTTHEEHGRYYFRYNLNTNKYEPIEKEEVEIFKNICTTWSIG